jgi:hypothetical protein
MEQKLHALETSFLLGKMNTEEFAAARKETFKIKLIITVSTKTGLKSCKLSLFSKPSPHTAKLCVPTDTLESRANRINFHKFLILAPGRGYDIKRILRGCG